MKAAAKVAWALARATYGGSVRVEASEELAVGMLGLIGYATPSMEM